MVDVHEIYRTDTGECVYRQIAGENVWAEIAYERCCEKYFPNVENQDEMLEYVFVLDVDPATVEEVLV